jgi:hypothetical protein
MLSESSASRCDLAGLRSPTVHSSDGLLDARESSALDHLPPCVAVKVCPAIVIVPVREPPPFDATRIRTVPDPVPLAPELMEIHDTLLVADHAQWLLVVTPMEKLLSPPALNFALVGAMA